MEVHDGYIGHSFNKPVVTLGIFDGVHLGHRMLLSRVVREAEMSGSDAVAVTFDPHPRLVLEGDHGRLSFLTDPEERRELIAGSGIDHLVVIPFTRELSRMSAGSFLETVLCRELGALHLVTGYNHHFGYRNEGDSETLLRCSHDMRFRVTREEAYMYEGLAVSSSRIREALERGDLRQSAAMLGYDYLIRGRVVSGKKIGRDMGFPTANIVPLYEHKLVPGTGVYTAEVTIDDNPYRHKAMLNIGYRPTISDSDGRQTVEVHLIGFSGDLYGKVLTVTFRHWLRAELKFDNIDAMTRQLVRDREMTLSLLKG